MAFLASDIFVRAHYLVCGETISHSFIETPYSGVYLRRKDDRLFNQFAFRVRYYSWSLRWVARWSIAGQFTYVKIAPLPPIQICQPVALMVLNKYYRTINIRHRRRILFPLPIFFPALQAFVYQLFFSLVCMTNRPFIIVQFR